MSSRTSLFDFPNYKCVQNYHEMTNNKVGDQFYQEDIIQALLD